MNYYNLLEKITRKPSINSINNKTGSFFDNKLNWTNKTIITKLIAGIITIFEKIPRNKIL